jgi:hypothetical protein
MRAPVEEAQPAHLGRGVPQDGKTWDSLLGGQDMLAFFFHLLPSNAFLRYVGDVQNLGSGASGSLNLFIC